MMHASRLGLRGKLSLITRTQFGEARVTSLLNTKYQHPYRPATSCPMASATTTPRNAQLKYLLVLDFEATCGDAIMQKEIIEFPTLVYNIEENKVQATFHEYVRPTDTPTLTKFCTDLTGITQDTVDAADTFPAVWSRFQEFLRTHGFMEDFDSHAFATYGNWDLKTMLPNQLQQSSSEHGLDASGNLIPPYNRWINIKTASRKHYKQRYNRGMDGTLKMLKMELEGRHHSGIDDCKNIVRIIQRMRSDGWVPKVVDTDM